MMSESDFLQLMAVGVGGTITTLTVLFLLFRQVVCWYWKINEIVRLLEEANANLRRLASTREAQSRHADTDAT